MGTVARFPLRESLMMVGMYAVGLVPGAILDRLTPAGDHRSWLPLMLGFLVGLGIGAGLWWLVRRVIRPSDMRDFVAIMLLS